MKTKNSMKNMVGALITNMVMIIVGFVSQKIFIKILGTEYLGINGLFSNIISMLGILELGIGSAIIFNLYKPLKEKNKPLINSLMKFYRKTYNIIAAIVLVICLSITPFLNFFIKEINVNVNIYIAYILFVTDIFCSYLLTYKRSIL